LEQMQSATSEHIVQDMSKVSAFGTDLTI
jgi:hypothetical protein